MRINCQISSPSLRFTRSYSTPLYFPLCVCVCPTETCILTKGKHLATAKALTDCQCFSLSWGDFQETLQGFPDVKKDLEKMVQFSSDGGLV